MPDEHLALRPLFRLREIIRLCLVQIDALDAVTAGRHRDSVINNRGVSITLAFPTRLAAECNRTYRALYRHYRQRQLKRAVLTCICLIINMIRVRSDDAAQIAQTMPFEIISFANRQLLFEMVLVLVFRQDQSVDVVTARLRILARVLVRTRIVEQLMLVFYAVFPVCPVEAVIVGYRSAALINHLRMLENLYINDRVTSNLVGECAALVVRRAHVCHRLVVTYRERRVFVLHLLHL